MDSELQHTVLVYSLHTQINKLLVIRLYLLAPFLTWELKISFLQRSVVAFDGFFFFFIKLSICCVCVCVSVSMVCLSMHVSVYKWVGAFQCLCFCHLSKSKC